MSKNININPDHTDKTDSREGAEGHGQTITYDNEKRTLSRYSSQPINAKAKAISSARSHSKKK